MSVFLLLAFVPKRFYSPSITPYLIIFVGDGLGFSI